MKGSKVNTSTDTISHFSPESSHIYLILNLCRLLKTPPHILHFNVTLYRLLNVFLLSHSQLPSILRRE